MEVWDASFHYYDKAWAAMALQKSQNWNENAHVLHLPQVGRVESSPQQNTLKIFEQVKECTNFNKKGEILAIFSWNILLIQELLFYHWVSTNLCDNCFWK